MLLRLQFDDISPKLHGGGGGGDFMSFVYFAYLCVI